MYVAYVRTILKDHQSMINILSLIESCHSLYLLLSGIYIFIGVIWEALFRFIAFNRNVWRIAHDWVGGVRE